MSADIKQMPSREVAENVARARAEAQARVKKEAEEFLQACGEKSAPTDCVIVYRNGDGSFAYSAPEGDGLAQIGMLDAARHDLLNKMTGVKR